VTPLRHVTRPFSFSPVPVLARGVAHRCLLLIDRVTHQSYIAVVLLLFLPGFLRLSILILSPKLWLMRIPSSRVLLMSTYPEIIVILYMLVLVMLFLTLHRLSKLRTVSLL
jgi:hypothetical protein